MNRAKSCVGIALAITLALATSCSWGKEKPRGDWVRVRVVRVEFQQGVSDGTGCGGGSSDALIIYVKGNAGRHALRVTNAHRRKERTEFLASVEKGTTLRVKPFKHQSSSTQWDVKFDNMIIEPDANQPHGSSEETP